MNKNIQKLQDKAKYGTRDYEKEDNTKSPSSAKGQNSQEYTKFSDIRIDEDVLTSERLSSEEEKALLQQGQKEYAYSRDFKLPWIQEQYRRLKLFNNQKRLKTAVGVPLMFTIFQVVLASLYEGFGLPVLQAMNVGTPVVSSDNSSLGEIVSGSALICDVTNPRDIADKISQILNDENLRTEIIAKGRERAKDFSWEKFIS
jgi:hypothetical protein